MKDITKLFHQISYLQYVMMLAGAFFCYRPFFTGFDYLWMDVNKGLIFLGLGISLSTLQDTSKTQNNFSKRIFEDPKRSRIFLWVVASQALFFLTIGLIFLFVPHTHLNELSFGLISVGVGLVGVLKSAAEMAEKHKKV
jgi:magnesium-transporting ATPase (P-type)